MTASAILRAVLSETAGGVAVLVAIVLVLVTPIALSLHERPPEHVVTSGAARGLPGLAIHPARGHPLTLVTGWLMVVGVALLGVYSLGRSGYAAAFCLLGAAALAYIAWAKTTGRAGDGTLTLTPDCVHQLYAGSEVFVPWEDVRGLVTTPTDFIVEITRPVVPVLHMMPLLGRRRVVSEEAVVLPRRGLPPLPYQDMIALYSENRAARDELATEEPVRRYREMLAAART